MAFYKENKKMDILKLASTVLLAERSKNEKSSKDCEKTNQDK